MKKLPVALKILLLLCLVACGGDDEGETYYNEYFSLDDMTSSIDLQVGRGDDAKPSNLIAAFVLANNDPKFDNSAIINLIPYDSEGSTAFPGPGWLQLRLPLSVDVNTALSPSQPDNTSTVLGSSPMPDNTFQAIYIDAEGAPHDVSGVARVISSDFTATDSYASYIGDLEVDLTIVDLGSPSNLNGTIYVSGEKNKTTSSGNGSGGSSGLSSDVPGGCTEYSGPEFDIQIDAQCQAAWAYLCAGYSKDSDPVKTSCAIYKALQKDYPNAPNCPYCN